MTPIDALTAAALGAVQGATEFLPVSSSGHVSLGAIAFGIPDMPLSMVVVVHAGTLLATLAVFAPDVARLTADTVRDLRRPSALLETERGRLVAGLIVASVPTAVIGLLLEDRVEQLTHVPWVIGLCLLVSAALVVATRRAHGEARVLSLWSYGLVGFAQGLAVMPGLSRSGTTIAAAMLLGLSGSEAFRLSFLLSLPAVAGAVLLKAAEPGAFEALGSGAVIAGLVALVVGYASLRGLRSIVERGRLWVFAVYLVPLGIAVVVWDAVR